MSKPENPQAFPDEVEHGMSLRDYFAAKAIPSVIAVASHASGETSWDQAAVIAYAAADAMLAARTETTP